MTSNTNSNLHAALMNKDDEFYTQYEDIKYYMGFWKDYLKDKIIYCPFDTDDSAFVKYFKEELKAGRIKDSLKNTLLYIYDKSGEPLEDEYKNVLYCDTLYDYKLADVNNFDFVILPVTSIGDEDLLNDLEFIKIRVKHTGVI